MKDLDIGVLFCEILGGLCLMLICVAALDLAGLVDVRSVLVNATKESTGWSIAGLLVAAYLVGIIVDAIGMAFDEIITRIPGINSTLGYDGGKLPDCFYAKSKEHQLAFWRDQWTYFSCYRNLLMLSVAWMPISVLIANKYGGSVWVWIILAGCVVTIGSLGVTVRCMQRVLATISKVG